MGARGEIPCSPLPLDGPVDMSHKSHLEQHFTRHTQIYILENVAQVELLRNIRDGRILDKFEIFEITKAKENGTVLLNNQRDLTNRSPLLSSRFLGTGK